MGSRIVPFRTPKTKNRGLSDLYFCFRGARFGHIFLFRYREIGGFQPLSLENSLRPNTKESSYVFQCFCVFSQKTR